MIGASTALEISPLPFQGPIGSVRLGRVNGQFIAFPTQDDLEESDLDLIVSGSKDAILMIEGFAREIPEAEMADAILEAHRIIKEICDLQLELVQKVGVEKKQYEVPPEDTLYPRLRERAYTALRSAKQTSGKHARAEAVSALKDQIKTEFIPDPSAPDAILADKFSSAWHKLPPNVLS